MSYFQEQTMIILTNTYCLENLLKLIFSEKTGEILNEEYTLEKRIEVFKGLLEFAKDFFLFSNKKKIESLHMKEVLLLS